jgi:hypothetical protein
MLGRDMRAKDWLAMGLAVVVALVLIAVVRWRQDIVQTTIDPKRPFQVYHPPPAPDYHRRAAWALLPGDPSRWTSDDPPADVFFIHPTTFNGGKNWNGPIDDADANRVLTRLMLPNYAGPFARVGRLFAPRYRQASIYTTLTLKDDARDAREFAYGDVRRAFDTYLAAFNQRRPIVIVGVEQGGTLAERLIDDELAADPNLARRLAAAYLVDAVALQENYGPRAPLPACSRRGQPRCVVGWTQSYAFDQADIRRTLERSLVWGADGRLEEVKGRPILCVNPVLGYETSQAAPARLNRGAANATEMEWGARPAFLSRQVSARCADGILRVSAPSSPALRETGGWLERLKEPGFNLFYADIEADAQARVASLLAAPDFARPAPPITTSIEVRAAATRRIR